MTAVESRPAPKIWTEEEICGLPDNGYKYEVVGGELLMSPKNNPEHGRICVAVSSRMNAIVEEKDLGEVWDSNTGLWMINRNLRAPDVSFVSKARLAGLGPRITSFFEGAPDLAVEVLSWSNTRHDMDERLKDFFSSGTKLTWIIDPDQEIAEVCHSLHDRKILGRTGVLDGENIIPGLQIPLAKLFRLRR